MKAADMTDLPEPAKQMAADLVGPCWQAMNGAEQQRVLQHCARTIERDAADAGVRAQCDARLEKALADLREIDGLLGSEISPAHDSAFNQAATIAARYRVEADPLADCLRGGVDEPEVWANELRRHFDITPKRGLELGRAK